MTGHPTDWNLATCLESVAAHRPDESIGRAENGKLDYPAVTARLAQLLEQEPSHA